MAKIKAKDIVVKNGTSAIASATSCTVNLSAQLDETRTKDTAAGPSRTLEYVDWSVSVDALNSASLSSLKTAMLAGTKLTLNIAVSGTTKLSGSAIISSLRINSPVDGKITYSVTFQGAGKISQS